MLLSLPASELERLTGAPSVAVHRAELIDLLADALGRDVIRMGAQCLEFLQNDAGVIARFADGSVEHGDVLIGADGLHSVVRAGLFGVQPPRYAGYAAWRGVAAFDRTDVFGESLGRGMRFGLVPLRGGRMYWFAAANVPENQPPSAGGHLAELTERFGDWHDPIPEVLRRTDPAAVMRNDIYDRDPVVRWGDGRVTLLGDAAHPMTPNLGQGACQAIEDAVELGQCLKGVDGAAAIPTVLKRYENRRIPRTSRIVTFSRSYGRFGQAQNPLACWARDRILCWTPRGMQLRKIAELVNGR